MKSWEFNWKKSKSLTEIQNANGIWKIIIIGNLSINIIRENSQNYNKTLERDDSIESVLVCGRNLIFVK